MMLNRSVFALLLSMFFSLCPIYAELVTLTLVPNDMSSKLGYYSPSSLELTPISNPLSYKTDYKLDIELKNVTVGVFKAGPADMKTEYRILLGQNEKDQYKLFIDTNANGNLSDDPAIEWRAEPYTSGDKGYSMCSGLAPIDLKYKDKTLRVNLGMYKFDPNDPKRGDMANTLIYYADYGLEGVIKLGKNSYTMTIFDESCSGDFTHTNSKDNIAIFLIDVNGNKKYENRGETYALLKPFNIKGVTYELKVIHPSGTELEVVKSSLKVPEILPPPDLSPGKLALAFKAKSINNKAVKFPSDYKGKIVLLDFWATWCYPCRMEIPNVVAVYEKYKSKGFEVLSVSLDQPDSLEKLKTYVIENKMTWTQIYDGKGWESALADLYGVEGIPLPLLVDGTTGKILADNNELRGEQLAVTLEKYLPKN